MLGVNTASYTPVPQVLLGLNMGLTWCCLYASNIQGTELNYPYLLHNERVNFSKIYIITPRLKACFSQGNSPCDEELVFFSKMAGDRGISLLCFFEVEVILEV